MLTTKKGIMRDCIATTYEDHSLQWPPLLDSRRMMISITLIFIIGLYRSIHQILNVYKATVSDNVALLPTVRLHLSVGSSSFKTRWFLRYIAFPIATAGSIRSDTYFCDDVSTSNALRFSFCCWALCCSMPGTVQTPAYHNYDGSDTMRNQN